MGFYAERLLPRIVNVSCGGPQVEPIRRRACAGLVGHVVEIGFGSGHNVPVYPATVDQVTAVEPSDLGWDLAADRVAPAGSRSSDQGSTVRRCRTPTTRSTVRCRR